MSEIKIPTNEVEARTMVALGIKWLEDNAPGQLTQHWRDMKAEAGRAGFIACIRLAYELQHPPGTIHADQYAESVKDGA